MRRVPKANKSQTAQQRANARLHAKIAGRILRDFKPYALRKKEGETTGHCDGWEYLLEDHWEKGRVVYIRIECDVPAVLVIVQQKLEAQGYTVGVANNGTLHVTM